jgi:hypothetical protein
VNHQPGGHCTGQLQQRDHEQGKPACLTERVFPRVLVHGAGYGTQVDFHAASGGETGTTPEVGGVGEVFARAAAAFDERELGQVIGMAVTINTCNRINVTVGRNHPAAEFRD